MTMAQCLSSHNLIVLLLLVLTTESKECEKWGPVTAVQNSAVTLRCPLSSPQPGITQMFWEAVHGDTAERINECPPTCPPAGNNNRTQLCERVTTVQDNATGTGSLTISPVNSQDASWYRCTVQTGNVKNCSEVHLKVKDEPPVQHLTKGCTIIDPFHAVVNSTLTYSAPVPHPNATQIMWGINELDRVVPITRCPSPCSSSTTRRPLCERVQTVEDAASGKSSLTISPVEETDTSWLSFIVNASSCYTFRLIVKGNNSQTTKETNLTQTTKDTLVYTFTLKPIILTVTTQGGLHTTPSPPQTVMVAVTSTVFACLLVALVVALVKIRLCVRKQKIQNTRKIELESQYAAYAEILDIEYPYSVVHHVPEGMCTFKDQ
ncbi:hypothetical protein AMEX_G2336 [Astyanax mexicanus]|uniref:Ig-like domain-containing protein n=1 Tax=Astyanax mexicanus TaxID=7994 RepID=A0A8T2MP55_ASTMX|nr:hypothetical protein AMEX_G2336 [Astyanax mexicanus]